VGDDLEIRAGDDERNATIDRLAGHFRAGRLTADELEERTTAAQNARTRGDLARLEADLPAPTATREPAARTGEEDERGGGFREHFGTYAVVITFLWILWALTGAGYPWPIWPMLGWGLGIALHWVGGRDGERERRLPGPPGLPRLPGLPPLPHERRDDRRDERRD
jgi:hypothetical protein